MRAATVVQVLQDFEAPPTISPRPPTTVANPHIDRSLGSKETHIQSHNRSLAVLNALQLTLLSHGVPHSDKLNEPFCRHVSYANLLHIHHCLLSKKR